MGDVFLAEARAPDVRPRLVALKRIRPGLLHDPKVLARFEREVKVCSLLKHPNIVATLEYGADVDGPFLAFEYVAGGSLAQLMARARGLGVHVPLDVALDLFASIARALEAAHEFSDPRLEVAGIVHRDLSPDNVLVGVDGTTRLADFGIARILGATDLTGTGQVVGKAGYIAPEVYEGAAPDPRSDLFSFGALAFLVLTGTHAFRGESEAATMRAVLSVVPPSVAGLRPEVPSWLAELVTRCLDKRPELRPSAREVVDALKASGALEVPHARLVRLMAEWFPSGSVGERDDSSSAEPVRQTQTGQPRQVERASRAWLAVPLLVGLASLAGWRWHVASREVLPTQARPAEGPKAPPPPAEERAVEVPRVPTPTVEEAPAPPPEAAATSTARRRVRAAKGALRIRVTPWAEVFLDGQPLGQTPVPIQNLEPGVHSLILVNPELGVRRSYQVHVKAGEQQTFTAQLGP